MGIDFYDKWVEDEIKDRKRIGGDMYDHRDDYVKRDKYNKLDERFEKAKELLGKLLVHSKRYVWIADDNNKPLMQKEIAEAEQFLSEVEK